MKDSLINSKIYGINYYPKNWTLGRFKNLCKIFSGGTPDTNNILYWDGNIPWIQSGKLQYNDIYDESRFITELGLNHSSTKMIKKDTPLLAMTGATCGNVGFLKINACANQSVMAFETNNYSYSRFIYYSLINSKVQILLLQSGGAQSGISTQNGMNLKLVFPEFKEQKIIADYLDKKCSKIDEIIKDNNKEIELIEEYKKSLLFNNLKYNIGYKKYRIKYVANLKGRIGWQGLTTSDYTNEGPLLIMGTDFDEKNGTINWNTCVHISEQRYNEDIGIHVMPKDLLITKDGTIGKLAIIDENKQATLNSGVMLIRENKQDIYNVKYLYFLLKSGYFWNWYNSNERGSSTIKHLYQEQLYNFSFYLPTLIQQNKIVEYLDKKCSKLDKVIEYRKQIIQKLEEYKKSLIYECVTGKREV